MERRIPIRRHRCPPVTTYLTSSIILFIFCGVPLKGVRNFTPKKLLTVQKSFRHSADERNSSKCLKLRLKLGSAGYGVYLMLLD